MFDLVSIPGFIPVDWLVSYEPAWLGPAVMLMGAFLLMLSYLMDKETNTLQFGIIIGIATFAALPWAFQNSQLIVILLSFTGSWFQGVGTVRGFLKIKHYVGKAPEMISKLRFKIRSRLLQGNTSSRTNDNTSSETNTTGESALRSTAKTGLWWLVFQLLGLLAIIMSVWVGVGLTTLGLLTIPSLTTDIVITWTLITTFGALLGLGWRFWSIRGAFPATSLLGVICIAAGAEVYNFRNLETEIALFLAAKGVYLLGFLGAIAVVVLANRSPESYTTTQTGVTND